MWQTPFWDPAEGQPDPGPGGGTAEGPGQDLEPDQISGPSQPKKGENYTIFKLAGNKWGVGPIRPQNTPKIPQNVQRIPFKSNLGVFFFSAACKLEK